MVYLALFPGLCVEFCRAYSRVRRWTEQVLLLRAEMQYTLGSLSYQAQWWESKAVISEFSGEHAEGVEAYAHKQVAVRNLIAEHFCVMWAKHLIGTGTFKPAPIPEFTTEEGADSDEELGGSDAEREEDDREIE